MTLAVIVPDASVLLKWILPVEDQPDTGAALSLREARNLSTTLRHRRLRFTEQSLLLWIWQVG